MLRQALAAFFLLSCPSVVQPGGQHSSWLIDGVLYEAHRARGADHAILRTGLDEYRFDVRPGDRWLRDAQKKRAKERAELKSTVPVDFDIDYLVSYDMRVDTPLPITGYIVAGQWHATEDPGDRPTSPPFSIEICRSDLVAKTRSIAQRSYTGSPVTVERFRLRNIVAGRWYRIAYTIRFSPTAGRLFLWIDDVQVYAGAIPIGFNDERGPYFKFGVYRPKASTRAVVRYRGVSIGALDRPTPIAGWRH